MASRLFDAAQIANALRNEAQPALEHLAGSSAARERALRRFDRDEPPPYVSSTEEDPEEGYERLALQAAGAIMPDEMNRLLNEPLDDAERDRVALGLASSGRQRAYHPGERYDKELELEKYRIETWASRSANDETKDYLRQLGSAKKGRAGRERVNIIARRNIRRRWQKLGVWNPAWGIPGRADNPDLSDETYDWKWRWQQDVPDAGWLPKTHKIAQNPDHPVTRVVQLREGVRRGEHSPVQPRSCLGEDASISQAESFITSRPWFMFRVELREEGQRLERVSAQIRRHYDLSAPTIVKGRWKDRGDWQAGWQKSTGDELIGWKWRHESPSPEPEDLSGLNNLATFEFSPSEADALEAIPPPTPTPPRAYSPNLGTWAPMLPISSRPANGGLFNFGRVDAPSTAAAPEEPPEPPPPMQRRRRYHPPPGQPLRRSARIAAKAASNAAAAATPARVTKRPAPRAGTGRPRKKATR